MTNNDQQVNEDLMERFSALINSSIPSEYKQLLNNFQEQGNFYTQLIQHIADKKDLSSFWDIPNTMGFSNINNKSDDWFTNFFDINDYSTQSKQHIENQFSSFQQKFSDHSQQNLKQFQSALQKMSELHGQISQRAIEEFNQLNHSNSDQSNEKLCQHWLNAGESAFNSISQQPDYIATQRQLFESLGALQTSNETFYEQFSSLIGLPSTQTQVDLTKALHELRIEFAEYRERTDEQLHTLQQQLKKRS
jgi:predicted nucleotide-binding protein (sugar kinase/HSP70/actin superfamily)